jgi:signal transduction histidine kinase
MPRFIDSVRVRLTFVVSLIFAGALTLAATALVQQVEGALINDVQVRNDALAKALGQLAASNQLSSVATDDSSVIELTGTADPELLQEGLNESFVLVQGPGAVAVNRSTKLFDRIRSLVTDEATPLFGKSLPSQLNDQEYVVSRTNVITPQGNLRLTVAASLDPIRRTVNRISNAMVVFVPTMLAAVVLLAWFMTGRVLQPVGAITRRARRITGSTLDQRVPVPRTQDEIGELARTMNDMLDRLEGAANSQRRFMSDASHELRSPVASISAQLEAALMCPKDADWEHVASTVLAEDRRLGALVDNLLVMSRLEEGVRRPTTEVDLDEVVYEQSQRSQRVPIDRSGVAAGRVIGVPSELTSVVRNLIDNAARHAASRVRVSVQTYGPVVRCSVEDDGPGVPVEDRERIFDRFARLQEARTRDAGGSGLGLALTKRIVETSGGKVFVSDSELGGACFVVELPSAAV